MCRFWSGLILRERVELCDIGDQSHESLIRRLKLRDDGTNTQFVRVECVPCGALDSTASEDWIVKVDQDILPDWYTATGRIALDGDFRDRVLKAVGEIDWKKVGSDLYLSGTQIKELPAGLKVGGNLDLSGTQIKELPAGLKVSGYLDLRGTQIKELPAGLKVGGYLDLSGTQIKELPAGLKVGGNLYLSGTQIELIEAAKKLQIPTDVW